MFPLSRGFILKNSDMSQIAVYFAKVSSETTIRNDTKKITFSLVKVNYVQNYCIIVLASGVSATNSGKLLLRLLGLGLPASLLISNSCKFQWWTHL